MWSKNATRRTRMQKIHNARTNVLLLNICVRDYVMTRWHARKRHNLQTKWRSPVRVKKAKSSLEFVLEDSINTQKLVIHAQRIVPYSVTKRSEHTFEELQQQDAHFDMPHHLIDQTKGLRKRKGSYEVLVKWFSFEDDDVYMTWEPLENICDDLHGILEDFLYTPRGRNVKQGIIDVYFKLNITYSWEL